MRGENSTRIPTRYPAVCTASAFPSSTRCRASCNCGSGATARSRRGTEVTFIASLETFTNVEYDFATLEHRLRELAFLNSGVNIVLSDMRHAVEKREEMRYD